MELIQAIDEILGTKFKVNHLNNIFELLEESEVDYPVTKIKTSGSTLVYKFDKNGELFPFFSQSKEFINKTSDYLIYNYNNDKKNLYIFIIELKSNKPNLAYKQLYASSQFVNYIISMANAYSKITQNKINARNLIVRHIVISKKSQKFATNVRKDLKYHKHPEYHFDYLHWQAGRCLNLTTVY